MTINRALMILCIVVFVHLVQSAEDETTISPVKLPRDAHDVETIYVGPVALLSPWKVAEPNSIDCKTVGRRTVDKLNLPITEVGYIWSGHNTHSVAGFICVGKRRTITCSRSFFGSDEITTNEVNFPPSVSHCHDAYKRFLDHHSEFEGYPSPNCHWLSTSTATIEIVHIESSSSQYDAFRGGYTDHSLHNGRCVMSPCLLSTKDGYWINSSVPTQSCTFGDPVEFKLSEELKSGSSHRVQFLSLSVMATDLAGSCQSILCDKRGIKLSTGEWISFANKEITDLPPCSNGTLAVKRLSSESVLRHMVSEVVHSQDYSRCRRLKEQMMENMTISRLDLSLLQPSAIGYRPVYKVEHGSVLVANADYQLLTIGSSKNQNVAGVLGSNLRTGVLAWWSEARKVKQNFVDGPNGLFWYKGELINPRTWEGSIPEILKEMQDPYVGEKETDLTVAEEHQDILLWDSKDILVSSVRAKWKLWITLILIGVVGLVLVIVVIKIKTYFVCKKQASRGRFFRA